MTNTGLGWIMSERFTVFRSTFEALRAFPSEDMKKAFVMFGEYALDGVLPEPEESVAYGLFCSIRPLIETSNKRANAGRSGGEATQNQHGSKVQANLKQNRSKTEAKLKQSEANTEGKIKEESINIKETLTNVSVKKSGFTPPTLQEVQEYIREKGYSVDAERFIDFYAYKGWMIGKNKMKDWRAAVRTWERGQRQETTTKGRQETTVNRFNNFQQRDYNFDELERKLTGRVP